MGLSALVRIGACNKELLDQGVTLTNINCFACVVLISILFVKEMLVATLHGHRHEEAHYLQLPA
jgi:hypothetical protein